MHTTTNPAPATSTEVVTFEVGSAYTCRSACDSDVAWTFEVVRRTAQFITLKTWGDPLGDETRCKVRVWNGVESASPLGTYSMSPVITADRKA